MIVARDVRKPGPAAPCYNAAHLVDVGSRLSVALGLSLLLAACGSAAPAAPASAPSSGSAASAKPGVSRSPLNPPAKVHVAYTGAAAESATFVGYERGYFK